MAKTRKRRYWDRNTLLKYYLTPNEDGSLKSYADVAQKFDIYIKHVERIGRDNQWVRRRAEQGEIINAQLSEDLAKEASRLNKELLNTWLITVNTLKRKAVKYSSIETSSEGKKVSERALKDFTDALRNATDKVRILTNQASEKSDVTNKNIIEELPKDKVLEIDGFLGKSYSEEQETNDSSPEDVNTGS